VGRDPGPPPRRRTRAAPAKASGTAPAAEASAETGPAAEASAETGPAAEASAETGPAPGTGAEPGGAAARRRLTVAVKESLRDLSGQLALLNRVVGSRLDVRDVDWDCLEIINRHGPLSPTALARRAGLHPATTTGVLDRLEKAGWIVRDRDPGDRRGFTVRALRERAREVFQLYAGMNQAMDDICAGYTEAELELLAGFLGRAAGAGRTAASDLVTDRTAPSGQAAGTA
jgi:DNA-binding MarR family transcriptional regulator